MSHIERAVLIGALRTHIRRYGVLSAITNVPRYIAAMRRAHAYLRSLA